MGENLYICDTYYHLLISLVKCIKEKGCNDLMIAAEIRNNKLVNNNQLIENIKKTNIFKNVYLFDYSREQILMDNSKLRHIKYLILMKKIIKENVVVRNFDKYKNLYLYYDVGLYGKIINLKKISYNIIEDGLDCYKNNIKNWNKKRNIKSFLKRKIFGFYELGESEYIKTIEVNDAKGLNFNRIKEQPKKQLFNLLDDSEKNEIFKIFLDEINVKKFNNCSLIITQPFFEDKKIDSQLLQIKLYQEIRKKYLDGEYIVIKTHPRENTEYKKYFKDCYIIDKPFPLEILNFCDNLKFNKVITVSSTSISMINNAKEKINLGWEYLEEFNRCNNEK